jgi:hypothetical protein
MIDVLLIPDVLQHFDLSMKALLTDGSYFHCTDVDPNGPYLKMTIPFAIPGKTKVFEMALSIPHGFVLGILTVPETLKKTTLGFGETE